MKNKQLRNQKNLSIITINNNKYDEEESRSFLTCREPLGGEKRLAEAFELA